MSVTEDLEELPKWDGVVRWGLHKHRELYTVVKYTGMPDFDDTYYGEPTELTVTIAQTTSRAAAVAVLRLFGVTEGMDVTTKGGWDVWGKIVPFTEDTSKEKTIEPWVDRSRQCPHCFLDLDEEGY